MNSAFRMEYSNRQELFSPIQYNLIRTLKVNGPLTRKELVNQLNTPRTTIYDNLVKLQKREKVKKYSRNNGKRGRPKTYWDIKK
jgi:predicted ArsR family transcriptional regulator